MGGCSRTVAATADAMAALWLYVVLCPASQYNLALCVCVGLCVFIVCQEELREALTEKCKLEHQIAISGDDGPARNFVVALCRGQQTLRQASTFFFSHCNPVPTLQTP